MIYQIYTPSAILKPYIHFYWIMEFDTKAAGCSSPQRIVPNGFIEVMFHFGDKLSTVKNNQSFGQPRTVISGQKTSYFDIVQTGKTGFVAILFKPHSPRLFFDIPMQKLTNHEFDIEDLIKNDARDVLQQIALAKSGSQKIGIVEAFLVKRLNEKHLFNVQRLAQSLKVIDQQKGLLRVNDLAKLACLSDKQYYRIFSEYVGLTPKQFLKIVRLQSAFFQIQTNATKKLTELAYNCGYYDQAHFIKDFKLLTGHTPKKCLGNHEIYSDYFTKN